MNLDLDYSDDDLQARYARRKRLKETFWERAKGLKACPCCNGQPTLSKAYWNTGGTYIPENVECECGIQTYSLPYVGDPDCIEIWNKRP